MNCDTCKKPISIKNTHRYISLLCQCGIIIIYPKKIIKTIQKEEYDANYKTRHQ